jgi:hypothetical protein
MKVKLSRTQALGKGSGGKTTDSVVQADLNHMIKITKLWGVSENLRGTLNHHYPHFQLAI